MVGASIRDGWATFRRHPRPLMAAAVLLFMVYWAIDVSMVSVYTPTIDVSASPWWFAWVLRRASGDRVLFWWSVGNGLGWLAALPLASSAVYVPLVLRRGESDITFVTVFAGYTRFLSLLGTHLLMIVIVGAGLLLAVVPGVIAGFGLLLAPLLVVDRGLGPVEAVKGGWAMMNGHKFDAFLLALACAFILFAGFRMFLFGLLVALPIVLASMASFYERVLAAHPLSPPGVPVVELGNSS